MAPAASQKMPSRPPRDDIDTTYVLPAAGFRRPDSRPFRAARPNSGIDRDVRWTYLSNGISQIMLNLQAGITLQDVGLQEFLSSDVDEWKLTSLFVRSTWASTRA